MIAQTVAAAVVISAQEQSEGGTVRAQPFSGRIFIRNRRRRAFGVSWHRCEACIRNSERFVPAAAAAITTGRATRGGPPAAAATTTRVPRERAPLAARAVVGIAPRDVGSARPALAALGTPLFNLAWVSAKQHTEPLPLDRYALEARACKLAVRRMKVRDDDAPARTKRAPLEPARLYRAILRGAPEFARRVLARERTS